MRKTVIQESDTGMVFNFDKLPNTVLRFVAAKKRTYKDNTHLYKVSAYFPEIPDKLITVCKVRGHKADAIKALENFIKRQ